MRSPTLVLGLGLALLSTRPAFAQTAPAVPSATSAADALDPRGIFDVQVITGAGQHGEGRLVINGTPDHYVGTIAPNNSEPLELSAVTVEKDSVRFKVAPPGAPGDLTFHLKFDGPSFSGRYEGLESGQISGTKIR